MSRTAALAAVLALLGAAACGGGGAAKGGLSWVGTPRVFQPRLLPRDRVVIGSVRNASSHTLHLSAAKLVVRDAQGRRLRSSAAFSTAFAHGLYGAFQQPSELPTAELVRLGRIVDLPPGGRAPFYAAWRLARASRQPARVDYGRGSLELPETVAPTAR